MQICSRSSLKNNLLGRRGLHFGSAVLRDGTDQVFELRNTITHFPEKSSEAGGSQVHLYRKCSFSVVSLQILLIDRSVAERVPDPFDDHFDVFVEVRVQTQMPCEMVQKYIQEN